jgi:hypothetical protein
LIHVKERPVVSLLAGSGPTRLRREEKMNSPEQKWPLSEPLFIALICAGYAAVAVCFFFMFNHANLQL